MATRNNHILIVGAGPGGLTAAMILAHRGFRVSVFEAKDRVGGRNASIQLGPYNFDTGPTFLMLKGVLDEVFREAGDEADNLMDIRRLEPMYRLQFAERSIEPVTDPDAMVEEISRTFPGHEAGYRAFRKREETRLKYLYPCLQKPYHKFRTLLQKDMMAAVPHLAFGRSLYDVMYRYFQDEELAIAFTFQAKYLGMSPWDCPGLFSIIPYIEHSMGVHHPIGGLHRISECMAEVARRNGAEIHLSTPVRQVIVKNRKAVGVELENGDSVMADYVVLNADFGHAMEKLFEPGVLRKYTPARLRKMQISCSTFMLYLGLDRKYDLPHHTICFAKDYRRHIESVAHNGELEEDFSFYVRDAGTTDPTVAPEGESALYILVPVQNLRADIDWETKSDWYRELLLNAVEERLGLSGLRQHIKAEKMITPHEWWSDYNVYDAATFSLAHSWRQLIFFRPHNKFEEIDRCFLVGGGTHPGSGLPTIYESGRIAANMISRECGQKFESANLHT